LDVLELRLGLGNGIEKYRMVTEMVAYFHIHDLPKCEYSTNWP